MADTTYPNLGLIGPEVNSSDGTWGGKLNSDLLIIDNKFAPSGAGIVVQTDASGKALVTGIHVEQPAGNIRYVSYFSGTSQRWSSGANSDAETGGNAGSAYSIIRYDDSGNSIDVPLQISRSSGAVAFTQVPTAAGSPIVTQATAGAFTSVIGAIQMFAGSGDPANWMVCDGRTLNTSAFAALFGVIGYAYGGSGSNFNIPNMAERVPIGRSPNPPALVPFNTNAVGTVFGVGTYTLTLGDLPSHQHTVPNPPHTHAFTWQRLGDVTTGGGNLRVTDINATADNQTATTQPSAAQTLVADPTGGGGAHTNVQPSIVLNFIIRVQ